jgi:hypothetical protein
VTNLGATLYIFEDAHVVLWGVRQLEIFIGITVETSTAGWSIGGSRGLKSARKQDWLKDKAVKRRCESLQVSKTLSGGVGNVGVVGGFRADGGVGVKSRPECHRRRLPHPGLIRFDDGALAMPSMLPKPKDSPNKPRRHGFRTYNTDDEIVKCVEGRVFRKCV